MQGEAMRKPFAEEVAQGMGGIIRRVDSFRNAPRSIGYRFVTMSEGPALVEPSGDVAR